MSERLTLSIDCGGLYLKSAVLDDSGTMHAKPNRIPTPYPLSPTLFVETIAQISTELPDAYRATVGIPGMIRNGVVVVIPHYVNVNGPNTKVDPELQEQWSGFDAQSAISARLGIPTLVLNDAEVHGAGIITVPVFRAACAPGASSTTIDSNLLLFFGKFLEIYQ
jgi:polyphosphate glucokinase